MWSHKIESERSADTIYPHRYNQYWVSFQMCILSLSISLSLSLFVEHTEFLPLKIARNVLRVRLATHVASLVGPNDTLTESGRIQNETCLMRERSVNSNMIVALTPLPTNASGAYAMAA